MGIPGNEQADKEAKAALDDDIQLNEEYPPKRSQKRQRSEKSDGETEETT
jgi:hypothetical protein